MSDQPYFSRAPLDAELDVPTRLSIWNVSDPASIFAAYQNSVVGSLIDALAADAAVEHDKLFELGTFLVQLIRL